MVDDYVMDIRLNGGHGYSNPMTDEEWDTITKATDKLDGFLVPFEVLVDLWPMEYINRVETVIIRKVR